MISERNRTMNIFLDVGGHEGQSLKEVLKPDYRFDVIHCFEPQAECYKTIKRNFQAYLGSKLVLHNFGLADFDGKQNLYGEGVGASIFADKHDINANQVQTCRFVSASSFFNKHINKDALVVMKLNCEGGEVLILRDLINSGHIHSLRNVMIDFDIRKVPSKTHYQEAIINKLNEVGFNSYSLHTEFMVGITHQKSIRWWLVNVENSKEFMTLTLWEKLITGLPPKFRCFLKKVRRKLYRKYNHILKRPSFPNYEWGE